MKDHKKVLAFALALSCAACGFDILNVSAVLFLEQLHRNRFTVAESRWMPRVLYPERGKI